MKASILDFLSFCVILVGAVFFMNADVLNRYSNSCVPAKEGTAYRSASFIEEAQRFQEQHALLPGIETGHKIQEESRSTDRPDKTTGESIKRFHACTLLGKDTPAKNSFPLSACSLPIYLFVCSLRL